MTVYERCPLKALWGQWDPLACRTLPRDIPRAESGVRGHEVRPGRRRALGSTQRRTVRAAVGLLATHRAAVDRRRPTGSLRGRPGELDARLFIPQTESLTFRVTSPCVKHIGVRRRPGPGTGSRTMAGRTDRTVELAGP